MSHARGQHPRHELMMQEDSNRSNAMAATCSSECNEASNVQFDIVVASTLNGGIGQRGQLAWHIPEDFAFFKHLTSVPQTPGKVNAVIMGRVTWESLPQKSRPLPSRYNIIISKSLAGHNEAVERKSTSRQINSSDPIFASSFENALEVCTTQLAGSIGTIFVIGGAQVYKLALEHPGLQSIFCTRVQREVLEKKCDVFVKNLIDENKFVPFAISSSRSHKNISYDFVKYVSTICASKSCRRMKNQESSSGSPGNVNDILTEIAGEKRPAVKEREIAPCADYENTPPKFTHQVAVPSVMQRGHEEFQYLDLIAKIMNEGFVMSNRTGIDTLTILGATMRFNLERTFPLLTTKRVFWKGVVEELLWFIRGSTDSKLLSDLGVKIWDANGSKEFLAQRGFPEREEGDLGPVYGFQWRHFGAEYIDPKTDYQGKGVDQLAEVIRMIREDPTNRRILLTAWNPAALHQMALPPCHMFCQFFVNPNTDQLSCLMYQRSADVGLGVPFNIASYSLLLCIIAQITGKQRGEFIHVMGNCHIYTNHVSPLKEQLKRLPRPFPIVTIDPALTSIDNVSAEHIKLLNYSPWPKISMEMAV